MPTIDEDTLRDLMHRSTGDLHAPPAVTAGIVASHRRRRQRSRALGVAVTAVAAGTAVGLAASGSSAPGRGAASRPARHALTLPALKLTAAQRSLYHLSSVAARSTRPQGRYAELTEITQTPASGSRTSVIDSLTGDTWTYQHGSGEPAELPVARHGSPTQAQFDATPTGTAALRALLLAEAEQDWRRGLRNEQAQLRAQGTAAARKQARELPATFPKDQSPDQMIFQEATDTLWNPLVGPALRAALLRVLAGTPGVTVDSKATDERGRPAVEISCVDDYAGNSIAVFERPDAAGVLEMLFSFPGYGPGGNHDADIFLSTTRSDTFPPDPYQHR